MRGLPKYRSLITAKSGGGGGKIPMQMLFTHELNVITKPFNTNGYDVLPREDYYTWPTVDNVLNVISKKDCVAGIERTMKLNGGSVKKQILNNEACISLVKKLPDGLDMKLLKSFNTETNPAYKAAICKGAVLYTKGGIWADPDLNFRMPLDKFIQPDTSFIASMAVGHKWQFFAGFFGAAKEHPVILNYLNLLVSYYDGNFKLDCPGDYSCWLVPRIMFQAYLQWSEHTDYTREKAVPQKSGAHILQVRVSVCPWVGFIDKLFQQTRLIGSKDHREWTNLSRPRTASDAAVTKSFMIQSHSLRPSTLELPRQDHGSASARKNRRYYQRHSRKCARRWYATTSSPRGFVISRAGLCVATNQTSCLRDQRSQKARYWLVLKEIIRTAFCFFLRVLASCVLVNNISARKISRREVGGPAQRLRAARSRATHGGTFYPHP
jgi:hypothetical protein